jgi:hypothetical protein
VRLKSISPGTVFAKTISATQQEQQTVAVTDSRSAPSLIYYSGTTMSKQATHSAEPCFSHMNTTGAKGNEKEARDAVRGYGCSFIDFLVSIGW